MRFDIYLKIITSRSYIFYIYLQTQSKQPFIVSHLSPVYIKFTCAYTGFFILAKVLYVWAIPHKCGLQTKPACSFSSSSSTTKKEQVWIAHQWNSVLFIPTLYLAMLRSPFKPIAIQTFIHHYNSPHPLSCCFILS